MSIDDLFDKSDGQDLGARLIASLEGLQAAFAAAPDHEATAFRSSVRTAVQSARQNPQIVARYCLELDWKPHDLALMMVMQCAVSFATSGEFVSTRGVLTSQGNGFRLVVERCLEMLVESGRITPEIADIERRELDADVEETEPLWPPAR